jgi:hypothetical protein
MSNPGQRRLRASEASAAKRVRHLSEIVNNSTHVFVHALRELGEAGQSGVDRERQVGQAMPASPLEQQPELGLLPSGSQERFRPAKIRNVLYLEDPAHYCLQALERARRLAVGRHNPRAARHCSPS